MQATTSPTTPLRSFCQYSIGASPSLAADEPTSLLDTQSPRLRVRLEARPRVQALSDSIPDPSSSSSVPELPSDVARLTLRSVAPNSLVAGTSYSARLNGDDDLAMGSSYA